MTLEQQLEAHARKLAERRRVPLATVVQEIARDPDRVMLALGLDDEEEEDVTDWATAWRPPRR